MPKHLVELEGYLAVLDSNTLVSASILPRSVPALALEKVRKLGRPVFSRATLDELTAVIQRPKFNRYLPLAERLAIVSVLEQEALIIEIPTQITACRDPKDDKFLALALAARASHLITGDADLLALHPFRSLTILTPRDFLAL